MSSVAGVSEADIDVLSGLWMKYVEFLRERKSYGVCNGIIVFKKSSRVHSKYR